MCLLLRCHCKLIVISKLVIACTVSQRSMSCVNHPSRCHVCFCHLSITVCEIIFYYLYGLDCFTWFGWAQGHFTSFLMEGNLIWNIEGCNTYFSSFRGETVGIPGWKLLLLLTGPGLEPGSSWTNISLSVLCTSPAAYTLS